MNSDPRTTPTEIRKQGAERIVFSWGDGHQSRFESAFLRGVCPCASCVDEFSGERSFGAAQVPSGISMSKTALVGSYAIQIDWSDGHRTGIYSFGYLREICPCDKCQTA